MSDKTPGFVTRRKVDELAAGSNLPEQNMFSLEKRYSGLVHWLRTTNMGRVLTSIRRSAYFELLVAGIRKLDWLTSLTPRGRVDTCVMGPVATDCSYCSRANTRSNVALSRVCVCACVCTDTHIRAIIQQCTPLKRSKEDDLDRRRGYATSCPPRRTSRCCLLVLAGGSRANKHASLPSPRTVQTDWPRT